ncbi:MAG: hypothetical protein ABSD49_04015 [Candidatus Bathyarchaeia archaeon]
MKMKAIQIQVMNNQSKAATESSEQVFVFAKCGFRPNFNKLSYHVRLCEIPV